ncbi:MAG: DUF6607 family protein [Crocinitomicaceae bacterium]
MNCNILFFAGILFAVNGSAQSKKELDIQAIKSLCGCYEIDFDYTETFAPDTNYEFHEDYHAKATAELAFIIEENENFISIQHLLIVGGGMIIKHWREDWIYENTDLYTFNKDLSWSYEDIPADKAKGTWTQKVFQVDDSPRYQGYATWVHVDGRHFWHDETYSPLPRREYSHRSDYNVMLRGNKIELKDYGWLHEQDNVKIIRTEEGDQILAQEKGFNKYKLQEDSKCQDAVDWWNNNKAYWEVVRSEWDKFYSSKKDINIVIKIEDNTLWEELFAIGDEVEGKGAKTAKKSKSAITSVIEKFTGLKV